MPPRHHAHDDEDPEVTQRFARVSPENAPEGALIDPNQETRKAGALFVGRRRAKKEKNDGES